MASELPRQVPPAWGAGRCTARSRKTRGVDADPTTNLNEGPRAPASNLKGTTAVLSASKGRLTRMPPEDSGEYQATWRGARPRETLLSQFPACFLVSHQNRSERAGGGSLQTQSPTGLSKLAAIAVDSPSYRRLGAGRLPSPSQALALPAQYRPSARQCTVTPRATVAGRLKGHPSPAMAWPGHRVSRSRTRVASRARARTRWIETANRRAADAAVRRPQVRVLMARTKYINTTANNKI